MRTVSATDGSVTSTRWKRRASARSRSKWRYSRYVVEPMQRSLARLQQRLQQVRRVHRPARGRPGAEDGVDLVDEEDRVGPLRDGVHQRLEARLEVAAIARAGEQRADVEREDLRVAQLVGRRPPSTMRCASPSAIAVFPTPVSPTKIGLFLRRRARIGTARSSSASRPISGSRRPARARSVRSVANAASGSGGHALLVRRRPRPGRPARGCPRRPAPRRASRRRARCS